MEVVGEEEEEEDEKMKTILVGVTLDTRSRELLTWSLVNHVLPGDNVVALHVLPSSYGRSGSNAKAPTLLSLAKDFNAMLAVFEGFCNLKQVSTRSVELRQGRIRYSCRIALKALYLSGARFHLSTADLVMSPRSLDSGRGVADFFSRGSLEEILHGEENKTHTLSWAKRYKVAIDVAEALDYLHSAGDTQPVIHRDVKSSNILLSDDFASKLSDFGLAKWALSSASHIVCDDVAGTFGYLAPEYFMYGKVDEKIDVYAFGVVLLELLSGKKPISTGCPKGQESLVMWAKPILHGEKVTELVDPCLGNEYNTDQMERMALAASLCIRRASRSRPQIAVILKLLKGDDDIVKWARSEAKISTELDELDGEVASLDSNLKSHLSLALHDLEDDSLSISNTEHSIDFITANTSLDEYFQRRCSRSLSFD